MTSRLPVGPVTPNEDDRPFWEAAAGGRLVLPRCLRCSTFIWYPRTFCPACASQEVEWVESAGRGTVYSHTVSERGMGPWAEAAPFVIAYVELEEGPRVLTNLVDCDPGGVTVGMAVSAVFDGEAPARVLRFRPV